jgi:hypothetical protein
MLMGLKAVEREVIAEWRGLSQGVSTSPLYAICTTMIPSAIIRLQPKKILTK